jgi:hypothetical protein
MRLVEFAEEQAKIPGIVDQIYKDEPILLAFINNLHIFLLHLHLCNSRHQTLNCNYGGKAENLECIGS